MQSDKLKAERVEALRQSLKTAVRLSFHESTHKENNRDIDALCDAYLTRPVPDPEQQEGLLERWTPKEREAFTRPLPEAEIKSMLEVCRITIHDGNRVNLETPAWVLAKLDYMALQYLAALASPKADPTPTLTDPHVVHMNMLRGEIAKLTPAQVAHLYSDSECAEIIAEIHRQRPTADHKTDGDAQEAFEAVRKVVQEAPMVPTADWFFELARALAHLENALCAQAKRCNALEREREALKRLTSPNLQRKSNV